jgi:transposase
MIEDAAPRKKNYTHFIGIDVSRNKLDFAVIKAGRLLFHKETLNQPVDILAFVGELKAMTGFTMTRSVFCMEHTGFYCNHLLEALRRSKANIVMENPVQIQQSLGILRAKNDKIDAIRIADYAFKCKENLRLWMPRRPLLLQLAAIFTLRNRMTAIEAGLKNGMKEQTTFVKKGVHTQTLRLCTPTLDAIRLDLKAIDKETQRLVTSDDRLQQLFTCITSVPSIGKITAVQLIITTNEFLDIRDPKKFACYAGVAPFKQESGKMKGKSRISKIANKKVKALLHVCALNAVRTDEELKTYYIRKTAEGKARMAVINAVRNKLILRVFACVNQGRPYQKDYVRPGAQQQVHSGLLEA